jgi:hypothetical protein
LVSSVLLPFDANESDASGPDGWGTAYGKTPEIIVAVRGAELDVFAQDYDDSSSHTAALLHLKPQGDDDYRVSQALVDVPMLDRVMGLAIDDQGNRYYTVGVDEADDISTDYPPVGEYRSDIVRVVKVNAKGEVEFDIDLDIAREQTGDEPERIINPMVAASARLAYGDGSLALVHGLNTDPDDNDVRHQKALTTHLDADNGDILKTSSIWCSHSFDQRVFHDGKGFIEYHLGDAYPRYVVLARVTPDSGTYPAFYIKGELGANNTHTRLGNMAMIENDDTYGYLALFATESTPGTDPVMDGFDSIAGPRNLGMVRIAAKFDELDGETLAHLDPDLPDTLDVNSSGTDRTNRLQWLTDYELTDSGGSSVERPKLLPIGDDKYIALWEQWSVSAGDNRYTFDGVYGMTVEAGGDISEGPDLITDEHHLHRGDDGFALKGKAAWMTGDSAQKMLYLHLVKESLEYETITIE